MSADGAEKDLHGRCLCDGEDVPRPVFRALSLLPALPHDRRRQDRPEGSGGAIGEPVTLLLWDLEGRDGTRDVNPSYVRGAHGLIYVVDGTRRETLYQAFDIRNAVRRTSGRSLRCLRSTSAT